MRIILYIESLEEEFFFTLIMIFNKTKYLGVLDIKMSYLYNKIQKIMSSKLRSNFQRIYIIINPKKISLELNNSK